jgi:hypothetical protein
METASAAVERHDDDQDHDAAADPAEDPVTVAALGRGALVAGSGLTIRQRPVRDQLEEGAVRVTEVDAHATSLPAVAHDRPRLHLDPVPPEVGDDLLRGARPDEAQIAAAGRNRSPRHERPDVHTGPVHVELLITEPERDPLARLPDDLSTQHVPVEGGRPPPVTDRNHAMIKPDLHTER